MAYVPRAWKNKPLPTYTRLLPLPYLPKSLEGALWVLTSQPQLQKVCRRKAPQTKGLCSTNICLPTAVGVKVCPTVVCPVSQEEAFRKFVQGMIKIRATITISPKTPIMGKPKKMSKLPISQEKKKKIQYNSYETKPLQDSESPVPVMFDGLGPPDKRLVPGVLPTWAVITPRNTVYFFFPISHAKRFWMPGSHLSPPSQGSSHLLTLTPNP